MQGIKPSHAAKQRKKRWQVTGAPGVEFNEGGQFYRNERRITPSGKNVPLIDLGPHAVPPVFPAHGGGRLRFADEIVCWEIYGPVTTLQQRYMHIIHLDQDWWNCAPDNLRRIFDPALKRMETAALMAAPPRKTQLHQKQSESDTPLLASIGECPEWLPISPSWLTQSVLPEAAEERKIS